MKLCYLPPNLPKSARISRAFTCACVAHCHRHARSAGINLRPHLGDATPDSFSWLNATVLTIEVWFFAHLTFYLLCTRSVSGRFLWPLVVELWPCSEGHVTTQIMQVFPVADLSPCFSTSMINLAVRDYSNVIWQWIKRNCWPANPYRSYDVIIGLWRHRRSRKRLRQ